MKKISVIIPAYNCGQENGIRRCVTSVISSSYENLQIIIIDDGSTDETWDVCQELERSYSNIECYHQTNEGCSSARANALRYATGDYLAFVDADDTVDQDYFEYLVGLLETEQADLVSSQFYNFYGINQKKEEQTTFFQVLNREEALRIYPEDGTLLNWNLCGKLLLTQLFCKNHHATGLKMASDSLEIFEYISQCNKVVVSNAKKYNYYHLNPDSITTSSFSIKKLDLLKFYVIMADKYTVLDKYPEAVDLWKRRAYAYAMTSAVSCYLTQIPDYKIVTKELSRFIRKNYNDVKRLTDEKEIKIFVLSFFRILFGLYVRIRN